MQNLPVELKFEMIRKLDVFDLETICELDKNWQNFCEENKDYIMKIYLKKHGVRFNEDNVKVLFKLLVRRLKEKRFYNDEFPEIVMKLKSISKDEIPDKNLINSFLKRDYTKYEYMVVKEALRTYKLTKENVKSMIKKHIYRYEKEAQGNPFRM